MQRVIAVAQRPKPDVAAGVFKQAKDAVFDIKRINLRRRVRQLIERLVPGKSIDAVLERYPPFAFPILRNELVPPPGHLHSRRQVWFLTNKALAIEPHDYGRLRLGWIAHDVHVLIAIGEDLTDATVTKTVRFKIRSEAGEWNLHRPATFGSDPQVMIAIFSNRLEL